MADPGDGWIWLRWRSGGYSRIICTCSGLVGLYRCLGKKAAFWTLAIFSVHLAGFNFSIFGLRDPLLSLAFSLVATMTARLFLLGIGRMDVAVLTFAAAMVMWLRIEQCYILVFLFLIPFLQFYVKSLLGSLQSRRWMRLMLSLTGPLLVIGVIGVLGATRIVAKNVGSDTANPMELAENNAEARFARAAGDVNGGGSHMVSVEAYNNMPLYKRVPLQMVALIVLPFPWQINGPTRLFAFLDSLMLIALMVLIVFTIVRRSWDDDSKKWFAAAMLSTYLVGLLGMGQLVSNAGNGFRLRISVTPFLMLAAVAAIPELLKRPPSIASSYPHSYSRNENRQPAQKACADLELV